ncbi:MAG: phosphoribosylformylglycinamidine synthase subunit PurS [Bifidobacteriaceae bacterium]|jgi:phosphoribosylformylglycinamidine synthase|nr:phosphoribosylformylglycinamidine synthase subunit PurS [Bifidobacteriaceae bacterium]
MARVIVDVMPKPELLDPQGKAVAGALPRLGFDQFQAVRQGKRFELEVSGPPAPALLEAARQAAVTVLSNPVIEDVVSVRFDEGAPSAAQSDTVPSAVDLPAALPQDPA